MSTNRSPSGRDGNTAGWGKGWQNQWHGVDLAFQTLERFGRAEDYTLILKSRVDVSYSDLDLEALWRRYGNSSSAQAAGGHFAVLAISQGWDVHAAATPPLARAFGATACMLIFSVTSLVGAFLSYLYVPETLGKNLSAKEGDDEGVELSTYGPAPPASSSGATGKREAAVLVDQRAEVV